MSSLSEAMRGVKPARRHTASSSASHRLQPPIQAEWRWFAKLSSGRRLMRQIGSSPMWRRLMLDRKLTAKATEVATRREQ
jgi:hypothetical protein